MSQNTERPDPSIRDNASSQERPSQQVDEDKQRAQTEPQPKNTPKKVVHPSPSVEAPQT